MTSETETTASAPASSPAFVTREAIDVVDIEAPIRALQFGEAHALGSAFFEAGAKAKSSNPESPQAAVYQALADICFMRLNPDAKRNPWRAHEYGNGWRTIVPDDYSREQLDVLAELAGQIAHPVLKARVNDLVWTLDRKRHQESRVAISAYIACVDGLVAGTLTPQYPGGRFEFRVAADAAERALQIAYMTSKRGALPDLVRGMMISLYEKAGAASAFVAFDRLANLLHEHELVEPIELAARVEAVANRPADYPLATKKLWDFAAYLYEKLGDPDARRRCQIHAVEQLLEMRKQVGTAGAEASWIADALDALRHVDDVDEWEEELHAEWRRLQKTSLKKDMGTFFIPIDVTEDRAKVEEAFGAFDLSEALRGFALLEDSRPLDELRSAAMMRIQNSPLMASMTMALVDNDGRTTKVVDGVDSNDQPDDQRLLHMIDQIEDHHRRSAVAGLIDPARRTIISRFQIREGHIAPIIARTPFVPASQGYILVQGFTAFFYGDFITAAHLVLPQLEPCLRHILLVSGEDPAKRRDDGTEEDRALGRIFECHRTQLEKIFGSARSTEIERLFSLRPGPALRHEMAHGQFSAGMCYHPTVVYAIWLMYRLCCIFVLRDWPAIIRPVIEAA